MIKLNEKEVDERSLVVAGIDRKDHPDYADAYFVYARYVDGTELSDAELDALADQERDVLWEKAYNTAMDI